MTNFKIISNNSLKLLKFLISNIYFEKVYDSHPLEEKNMINILTVEILDY